MYCKSALQQFIHGELGGLMLIDRGQCEQWTALWLQAQVVT